MKKTEPKIELPRYYIATLTKKKVALWLINKYVNYKVNTTVFEKYRGWKQKRNKKKRVGVEEKGEWRKTKRKNQLIH